MTTQMTGKQFS